MQNNFDYEPIINVHFTETAIEKLPKVTVESYLSKTPLSRSLIGFKVISGNTINIVVNYIYDFNNAQNSIDDSLKLAAKSVSFLSQNFKKYSGMKLLGEMRTGSLFPFENKNSVNMVIDEKGKFFQKSFILEFEDSSCLSKSFYSLYLFKEVS